jgi:Phage late-transcription coactivator
MLTLSPNTFINEIEDLRRSKNMEYIDAVVHWCEKNKVEIEYIAAYIKKDQTMKLKIQEEAENLNYMKKTARLPI